MSKNNYHDEQMLKTKRKETGVTIDGKPDSHARSEDGGKVRKDKPQPSDKEEAAKLPPLICLGNTFKRPLPPPPETLIDGILCMGEKLVIAGAPKAGKSMLLMELAAALACGTEWLGFSCTQSRVLYVNLELREDSCERRFRNIYQALSLPLESADNIIVWNLRGRARPLDELVPYLIKIMEKANCDVIIIDPIYKILTGDENSASEMAYFCNQFDRLAAQGKSVIYAHHHNKSANATYWAGNRMSGSGVFARDVDALVDIIQLAWDGDENSPNTTAWRVDMSLRNWPDKKPLNMWYDYPIHIVDRFGDLDDADFEYGASTMKKQHKSPEDKKQDFDAAYDACYNDKGIVRVADMAQKLSCCQKTVRRYVNNYKDTYSVSDSIITRVDDSYADGWLPFQGQGQTE